MPSTRELLDLNLQIEIELISASRRFLFQLPY